MRYTKAPITEAVINLQTLTREGLTASDLLPLEDQLRKRYTERKELYSAEMSFQVGPPPYTSSSQKEIGYRLTGIDKKHILQVTITEFTLSAMPPYDNWDSFRDEAKDLWRLYKQVIKPISITRVATRYINRFSFPGLDLRKYVRVFPVVGDDFPCRDLEGFVMQLQIPQSDLDSKLVLNAVRLPDPRPESLAIILDFDLFREYTWPPEQEEQVWDFLEQLHTRKNELFEASITDETRKLIK